MSAKRKPVSPLVAHRRRQRALGFRRLEVQVPGGDAALLRSVAAALSDPVTAPAARALLRSRFLPPPPRDLKALLEAAPLEGVDLERSTDTGRDIAF